MFPKVLVGRLPKIGQVARVHRESYGLKSVDPVRSVCDGRVSLSSLRNEARNVTTYGFAGLPSRAESPNPANSRVVSISFLADGRLVEDDSGRKLVTAVSVKLICWLNWCCPRRSSSLKNARVSDCSVGTSYGASCSRSSPLTTALPVSGYLKSS